MKMNDLEPNLTRSPAGSISSDEDLEGGQFQFSTFTVSTNFDKDDTKTAEAREELIVPKCVSFNGRRSRRLSSDNLPFQRRFSRRESEVSDSNRSNNSREERGGGGELPMTHRPHRRTGSMRSSVSSTSSDPVKGKSRSKFLLGMFLATIAVSVTYTTHLWRVAHLHQKVDELHARHQTVAESHGKLTEELKTASHNIAQYNHMTRLKEQHSSNLLKRAEEAESRLQDMIDKVQKESAQQVLELYGHGPYVVELDVQLSSHTSTIRIELDSVERMPHAISVFLHQVQSKVWNGATLASHDGKLIFIPHHDESKPTTATLQHAPSVLFAEYSDANPHKEYTVAFFDQDLYINVKPDSRIEDEFVEGESCFGKVSKESRDVIDEMNGDSGVVVSDMRIVGS